MATGIEFVDLFRADSDRGPANGPGPEAGFDGMQTMPDDPLRGKMSDAGDLVEYDGDEIVVTLGGQTAAPAAEPEEFGSNLAVRLTESEQVTLGSRLKEFVEVDLTAREAWERRLVDGLEIIGLQDLATDAVAFEGAARATYPGLAEAMVQFQARSMDELMPAEGPVKAGVLGEATAELEAQAERVQDYMNYQLIEEDEEYYTETDDMLIELPFSGSAFRKVAPDPVTGRTSSRLVKATDFIVPYSAKSLKSAPRYTHRYSMSKNTFERAVDSGYFVPANFSGQGPPISVGTTQKIADASDNKTEAYHPDDLQIELAEITIDWKFEWETYGKTCKYDLPYVITFEWETGRVVRIARVWQEDDPKCRRDVWFVHYKFLPSLGFYGWGYLHLIGGLGRAASSAMRLLLDGSATSSLQGGFKSSDCRMSGEVAFTPGQWQDVDMSAEELAKSFFAPPFKEPSPALFKTLEILVSSIQRFASTTEQMVGDASNAGPVGTTVALIEQGSKIFSGIHKRIHAAARREFKLIARCNYLYMEEDEFAYGPIGKRVSREDFSPQVDVIPVSDPNIFSSVQRIALAQATVQLVDSRPDLYDIDDARRAHKAMFKALRLPDADQYLKSGVRRMDPVSENVAIMNGRAVQVFVEQDDEAHMAVHAMFEQEVMARAEQQPEIASKVIPALKAHLAAHYANAYRKRIEQSVMQATGVPLPPYDPNNPRDNEELPPDIENMVARAVAQFAPPPPAPAPAEDPEAAEDMAAQRRADREDMLAQRKADRDDALARRQVEREDEKRMAELKRDGFVNDLEPEEIV